MDINCAKCHEPWDAYGVRNGDMTTEESRRFLRGEGCPGCNFGTKCPSCSGSGKERDYSPHHQCQHCHGQHYLIVRLLDAKVGRVTPCAPSLLPPVPEPASMVAVTQSPGAPYQERPWGAWTNCAPGQPVPDRFAIHYDFVPNVKTLTPEQRAKALFMEKFEPVQCRDGWYIPAKLACPFPHPEALPCTECGGDGKFHPRGADNTALFQAAQQLLGDDTDGLQAVLEDLSV